MPGKTFMGTLVVDDSQAIGPDFMMAFYAPKADTKRQTGATRPPSWPTLCTPSSPRYQSARPHLCGRCSQSMRQAGHRFTEKKVRDAVDDLIVAGRLTEVFGKRGAKGYQAPVTTAAEEDPE